MPNCKELSWAGPVRNSKMGKNHLLGLGHPAENKDYQKGKNF